MIPYFAFGRVTEFKVGVYYGDLFRGWNGQQLRFMKNFGPEWGFIPDGNALVFVDNHDNQRGHGAGGAGIITFFETRLYKLATAFNLAWPYGVARVMSSYDWDGTDASTWVGPPHDADFNTSPVTVGADGTCGNGWICEHRWRQIYHMTQLRNIAVGTGVEGWWDGGEERPNQIAFSRGDKAFVAINNDDAPFAAEVPTRLGDGEYCDMITSDFVGGVCSGRTVRVSGGRVSVDIPGGMVEDSMIAIHVQAKVA